MSSLKPLVIPHKPVGLASPTGFVSLESKINTMVDIKKETPGAPQAAIKEETSPPADDDKETTPAAPAAADSTPGAPPVVASTDAGGDAVKKADTEKEIAVLARKTRRLLTVSDVVGLAHDFSL